ncbi:unnamed protein product, partial [Closterium sp. Naga37s-1]
HAAASGQGQPRSGGTPHHLVPASCSPRVPLSASSIPPQMSEDMPLQLDRDNPGLAERPITWFLPPAPLIPPPQNPLLSPPTHLQLTPPLSTPQMSEDMPLQLDRDIPGLAERPITGFLPPAPLIPPPQNPLLSPPTHLQLTPPLSTPQMSEDMPLQLDRDIPGLAERPITVFLPRLLQQFASPHASLRKMALGSVNQFILHMPRVGRCACSAAASAIRLAARQLEKDGAGECEPVHSAHAKGRCWGGLGGSQHIHRVNELHTPPPSNASCSSAIFSDIGGVMGSLGITPYLRSASPSILPPPLPLPPLLSKSVFGRLGNRLLLHLLPHPPTPSGAAGEHGQLPAGPLFALGSDPIPEVRAAGAAGEHGQLPAGPLFALGSDPIPEVLLVLLVNMDSYLQGLFALGSDPIPEVRKLVCSAVVQLIELQPSFLLPHMRNVIEYMLASTRDSDPDVALEACEFWSAYCENNQSPEMLREFLPQLVTVLLTNMVYADDDEAVIDAEDEGDAPDSDQDLKPRFHQSRLHGANGEDAEEDYDESASTWNLRKCSAAGLDILSHVFGDALLPILMPLIQTNLADRSEGKWKEREASVLAVGAVAEGCIDGLLPALPQMIAHLLPLLEDPHPLVRSISCWTLSRYSKWIARAVDKPEGQQQFDAVLTGFLARILDNNKRVQEAACSAFATLEEWIARAVDKPEGQQQFDAVLTGFLAPILDNNKRVQEAACSAFATLEEVSESTVTSQQHRHALTRYSKWIARAVDKPEGQQQFDAVLTGFLARILDNNKRVQEAACSASAFGTLDEVSESTVTSQQHRHALTRYSKWIAHAVDKPEGQQQFDAVLTGFLARILDNKRVQEAACSAFATLEEEAVDELPERLEPILQHLAFAFSKYQGGAAWGEGRVGPHGGRGGWGRMGGGAGGAAWGGGAGGAAWGEGRVGPHGGEGRVGPHGGEGRVGPHGGRGGALQDPRYIAVLMPPLTAKWQQISDFDRDIFPLLECFTSVAQALGPAFAPYAETALDPAFAPYAETVLARCCHIIRVQLVAQTVLARCCHIIRVQLVAQALGPAFDPYAENVLARCCHIIRVQLVAQALGPAFAPYAETVLARCCYIIRVQLVAQKDPAAAGAPYDKEFIVCALDLSSHLPPTSFVCSASLCFPSPPSSYPSPPWQKDPAAAGAPYDKEFIVCALDLSSGVIEALGPSVEPLVAKSGLTDLLLQCSAVDANDVKQSSLALLGDLTKSPLALLGDLIKSCVQQVRPHLNDFLSVCVGQLNVVYAAGAAAPQRLPLRSCVQQVRPRLNNFISVCSCVQQVRPRLNDFLSVCVAQLNGPESFVHERISVANNACWALGELAVKVREEIAPAVVPVLNNIVPVLTSAQNPRGTNLALVENCAITLGRFAWVCPDVLAPQASLFLVPFLTTLKGIRDDVEKEEAFKGLCAVPFHNYAFMSLLPSLSRLKNRFLLPSLYTTHSHPPDPASPSYSPTSPPLCPYTSFS